MLISKNGARSSHDVIRSADLDLFARLTFGCNNSLIKLLQPCCRKKRLPFLISERGFGNPVPLKISHGGLESIPDGLDILRNGKVSGSKLAYVL